MGDRAARLEALRKIVWGVSSVEELEKRTGLDLDHKNLTSVPLGVCDLTGLVKLGLSGNQLSSLPPEISRLTGLMKLDVDCNQLSSLPPEISQLTGITRLDVSYNQLSSLPPEISRLTGITYLNISQNKISNIPNMQALTNLKELNVRQNAFPTHVQLFLDSIDLKKGEIKCPGKGLKEIPQELFFLPAYPVIDLSNNEVSVLPSEISRLMHITHLNISQNKIEVLPPFLGKISTLRSGLKIDGNPIKNVPQNVIKQGSQAVFDFLKASVDGHTKWTQGRLLLLGEGEAGKTTLTKSIMQKSLFFNSTTDQERERTDGIAHVDIDESVTGGLFKEKISIRIWDFGGQEEFQVTHPFFLSAGALVLILYRLDRSKEKNNLSRWIKMLDDFAPGSKIIVAGTHQDVENRAYAQEMKQEIDSIKKENNRHTFISTELRISNRSGKNISDLKKAVYEGMLKLDNMNKDVPKTYFRLKEYLDFKGKQRKYEKIQDTYDFAEKELKMDKYQCESALKFLHDLGSVVWYSSFEDMKDIVFLDPLFLINIFRCVFSFKGVGKDSSGIILLTKLKDKIKQELNVELDEHVFSTIINIFDHFGLGIHFNKECIAFPSLMEDCQNIIVLWNEKPETNCVSEISAVMNSNTEVHLSDKSNIIVQALRLTKGASSEIQYEDHFFRDVALIHLKASYGKESKEPILVPGNEFIIFIRIYRSNISIKIRKYDSNYDESVEAVRIFDVLSFLIKQISSIRTNFIQNCQMECPECRLNGLDGCIQTNSRLDDSELTVCSRKHQLDIKIVQQGRVYMEQGMISKRVQSAIRGKKGKKKKQTEEILELESIDEKLKGILMNEQAELMEYIGKGVFGRVYKTKHQGKEAVVKIQTIKQTGQQTISELIESLIFESNYLHECRENENIVRLFGVYRKDDDFFMIMEHAGISLKTMLERNQVKLKDIQIVSYAKQICQGLVFMHSKNLYHEDLKADNVMIVEGIVKIVDFGIVSRRGLEKVGSNQPTQFGEDKQDGTNNWQAPEIHEVVCKPFYEDASMYGEDGANIGHRGEASNVYALGMLVWYMFSGIEPFNHEAYPDSFTMRGLRPEIPSSTPSEFIHLIKACWKQNYKLRPTLQMVCKYLDTLSSKQFKLSQKEMIEKFPIKYSPLMDMYRGEFVEWLRDHQFLRFSQVIAEQAWNEFIDVKEEFNEKSMLEVYHISPSHASAFVELSKQNVNVGIQGAPIKLVKELYHFQLHDYLKKRLDEASMRLLEKVKALKLTGDIISKLDKDEVLAKYSFSKQELSSISQFINEHLSSSEIRGLV